MDVIDGYIAFASAREDYGVVLDEKTCAVDVAATRDLRATRRRAASA